MRRRGLGGVWGNRAPPVGRRLSRMRSILIHVAERLPIDQEAWTWPQASSRSPRGPRKVGGRGSRGALRGSRKSLRARPAGSRSLLYIGGKNETVAIADVTVLARGCGYCQGRFTAM